MLSLGACPACSTYIRPNWTTDVRRQGDTMMLQFVCQSCELRGMRRMGLPEYESLVTAWRLSRNAQPDSRVENGLRLQGWRIDLDAVETVADMELYWDYQQRYDRGSIPVEV